jgi:hypothetical protein
VKRILRSGPNSVLASPVNWSAVPVVVGRAGGCQGLLGATRHGDLKAGSAGVAEEEAARAGALSVDAPPPQAKSAP